MIEIAIITEIKIIKPFQLNENPSADILSPTQQDLKII